MQVIDTKVEFESTPSIRGKEVVAIIIEKIEPEYSCDADTQKSIFNLITKDENFVLCLSPEQIQKLAEALEC